jgi:hypothetical protein
MLAMQRLIQRKKLVALLMRLSLAIATRQHQALATLATIIQLGFKTTQLTKTPDHQLLLNKAHQTQAQQVQALALAPVLAPQDQAQQMQTCHRTSLFICGAERHERSIGKCWR